MDKYTVSGTYDKRNGLQLVYVKRLQDKKKEWDKQDVAEAHHKVNEELKDMERYK